MIPIRKRRLGVEATILHFFAIVEQASVGCFVWYFRYPIARDPEHRFFC